MSRNRLTSEEIVDLAAELQLAADALRNGHVTCSAAELKSLQRKAIRLAREASDLATCAFMAIEALR